MNPLMNRFGQGMPANMNNFTQFVNMLKNGQSPQALINMMAQSNPQAAEAVQMMQSQSPQQLEQVMRKMCANKGINFDQAFAQFKQMIGK